jgi:hypothetical protein
VFPDYITLKLVQQELAPAAVTPLRFAIASAVFAPALVASGGVSRYVLMSGLELGLWFGIGFCAQVRWQALWRTLNAANCCGGRSGICTLGLSSDFDEHTSV